jgi:hypothetical protein
MAYVPFYCVKIHTFLELAIRPRTPTLRSPRPFSFDRHHPQVGVPNMGRPSMGAGQHNLRREGEFGAGSDGRRLLGG